MIRANNPKVDVAVLREKVRVTAEALSHSGAIEERRRERAGDGELSPRMIRARHRAVILLLERAEDLNVPRGELPRRLARLKSFGGRPARLLLRVYNYVSRPQRDVASAQLLALRELSSAMLTANRRVLKVEHELQELRRLIAQQRSRP